MAAPEAPGADRRRPKKSRITYPVRAALSAWLQAEAKRAHADFGRRYRVLDVGSGIKPYAPFFEPYVESYVGVDIGNPAADLEGSADALPWTTAPSTSCSRRRCWNTSRTRTRQSGSSTA